MSEQLSVTSVQPSTLALPPVKLWTPRAVGNLAFFLGFPGGYALAALNRLRMGLTSQAVNLLIVAAMQAVVYILLIAFMPGGVTSTLSFVLNIATAFYLNNLTQKDVNAFRATTRQVQNAHWFGGVLIALLAFALFLVVGIVILFILIVFFGVQIPQ